MTGIGLVILSSMMAALINTYCAGNTQEDTEEDASVLGEEGEGEPEEGEEGSGRRQEEYTSLDGRQEEEDSMPKQDYASTSGNSSAQESNQ